MMVIPSLLNSNQLLDVLTPTQTYTPQYGPRNLTIHVNFEEESDVQVERVYF